jgi:DNA-binding transcriptional MerR regulator
VRTVDVARRAGCSVQQVRKLEAAGVLPPAPRRSSGYREYAEVHVASLLAYRQLAVGVGPVEARLLLYDAHRDLSALLARLDAAHARLHRERRVLDLASKAVQSISAEPMTDVQAEDAMSIGELSIALGLRPSTLRHWETEGLLTPTRTPHQARRYSPVDVRDARLIHQLRQAGYRIAPLRDLLPTLREPHDWDELLTTREQSINARAEALLQGTATIASMRAIGSPAP